jgi:hypothetical protein
LKKSLPQKRLTSAIRIVWKWTTLVVRTVLLLSACSQPKWVFNGSVKDERKMKLSAPWNPGQTCYFLVSRYLGSVTIFLSATLIIHAFLFFSHLQFPFLAFPRRETILVQPYTNTYTHITNTKSSFFFCAFDFLCCLWILPFFIEFFSMLVPSL